MESDSSLIVGVLNISSLTDQELYEQLITLGAAVGPIVGTTRKTYERKLAVLLGGEVDNYSQTGELIQGEPEHDVEPSKAYIDRLAGDNEGVRRRTRKTVEYTSEAIDSDEEQFEEESPAPRLYSPSPRKPLRSADTSRADTSRSSAFVVSSPTPSFTPSAASSPGAPLTPPVHRRLHHYPTPTPPSPATTTATTQDTDGSGSMMMQLLMKVALLIVMALTTYYFVNLRTETDAFASLEHLANTAAEAIEKENKQG